LPEETIGDDVMVCPGRMKAVSIDGPGFPKCSLHSSSGNFDVICAIFAFPKFAKTKKGSSPNRVGEIGNRISLKSAGGKGFISWNWR
jgi:hypothetical protein